MTVEPVGGTVVALRELVIANQTLGRQQVHDQLVARAGSAAIRFHLLVPATPLALQEAEFADVEHLPSWPGEDPGFALARVRLERALRSLELAGVDADGSVGAPDPLAAVRSHLARHEVDRIVVSTLSRRRSRWLRRQLPEELGRLTGLPVEHLELTRA
jgi:GABA permease